MSKVSCRSFWMLVVLGIKLVSGLPVLTYDDDYTDGDDDYDVIFDQRQNGTENVRISVDGVVVAVPAPPVHTDISTLAGAAFVEILNAQLAAMDSDSSDEESPSTTTTSTTTTTTTTASPIYHDQLIPSNFLGQSLSFLFNKGVEIPIKIASELKPLRTGKPAFMVIKKGEESDDEEYVDPEPVKPVSNVPKKASKPKRRYKLKTANLLKPLLQRTYLA
ncbi:uncharacterized protein LOC129730361 [Wyeomyia smithii]|uniref:uncharacterized protein LOC129730361 n=1 Tax=Wyeomyia smithii TaxID=174621 RepID=UPI002467D376|nr:uncharacterized protein LOC129730361 [Wyeomyia smithii]